MLKYLLGVAALVTLPLSAGAAVQPQDAAAVAHVQSTWNAGQNYLDRGEYTRSIAPTRSTMRYLGAIKDPFTRGCVANGIDLRIASARAGRAYLVAHHGDKAGAKAAAHQAWVAFPVRHDCP